VGPFYHHHQFTTQDECHVDLNQVAGDVTGGGSVNSSPCQATVGAVTVTGLAEAVRNQPLPEMTGIIQKAGRRRMSRRKKQVCLARACVYVSAHMFVCRSLFC
jgi:hypothetical protein